MLAWQSLPKLVTYPEMRTINVNLTDALDRFVSERVASGKYENASEVVGAGLRELERHETTEAMKVERLRRLIEEGEASGIAEDFSFDDLLAESDREFAGQPDGPRRANR
jgi:antitoxin ParD1/3/4